jgi:biotin carboxylase
MLLLLLQVYTIDNVPECVEKVGFPMIVKPTSGAGSMGVYKVVHIEGAQVKASLRCLTRGNSLLR